MLNNPKCNIPLLDKINNNQTHLKKIKNIKHQVLNAKQHAKEADVVTEAGKPGTVTIATNPSTADAARFP